MKMEPSRIHIRWIWGGGYVINGIDLLLQHDFTTQSYGEKVSITTPIDIENYNTFIIRYHGNSSTVGNSFPSQDEYTKFTLISKDELAYFDSTYKYAAIRCWSSGPILHIYGTDSTNPNTFSIMNMAQNFAYTVKIFGIR